MTRPDSPDSPASPGRPTVRVRVIGVGPGDPDQVTVEAVTAMRSVASFVVSDKSSGGGMPDPLVAARGRLLERHLDHEPTLVRVVDPERERRPERTGTPAAYDAAVATWHDARSHAYQEALTTHPGDVGFLVWGDPAFYDSTLRVLDRIQERGEVDLVVDVIPGVSSISLLAARHRVVLHEIGAPLHVTTARRLHEALASGQDNVVVVLNRTVELHDLPVDVGDWQIWWGANLGTASEELVAGRVDDALPRIDAARERAKLTAGWVMDVYLLRRPA